MAATTSTPAPRKSGFDFAALSASAGRQDSADEVARLRAALETLAELVVAHGVMDARTLQSIVGDLIATPMMPVALSAPLPPPAPSAAEALLRGPIPKPAAVAKAAAPVAAKPVAAAAPVAARPVAAAAPVAARPVAAAAPVAAKPVAAAAPVAAKPVAAAPASVAAPSSVAAPASGAAPTPVAAAPVPVAVVAPIAVVAAPVEKSAPIVVPPSTVQPVVASPFPSEPAPVAVAVAVAAAPARKNPFDAKEAARLEAELTDMPPPALKPAGFLSRLFGKPKTSPAAVAKAAASVEFTERVTKSPFEGLYAEQQRATELSFPPTAPAQRKPRAAAPAKKQARPADAAPARFCDRCWRRMDATGTCKTCSASASV